jgi:hypothetical protein
VPHVVPAYLSEKNGQFDKLEGSNSLTYRYFLVQSS